MFTNGTGSIAKGASLEHSPSISRNGRVLVFESETSWVSEDDNNKTDVYFYDVAEQSLRYISQTSDGTAGNDVSSTPLVSGAGQSVVFESSATNFTDGAIYNNIYLTDLTGMINYAPPYNLSFSDITSNQVKLSWYESVDKNSIDGYRIYQNNIAVATTSEATITISDLSCETDYNFKVRAFADDQESIPSNTVNVSTSSCVLFVADPDPLICSGGIQPFDQFFRHMEDGASSQNTNWNIGAISGNSLWNYSEYTGNPSQPAHSGDHFYFGDDNFVNSDSYLEMKSFI